MSPGARQHEKVYAELKQALLAQRYTAGRDLSVLQLASDIGTSVSPVRDALHRLYGEGLLEMGEHRGFRLRTWSVEALRDCYTWHGHLIRMALKAGGAAKFDGPAVDGWAIDCGTIDCASPDRIVAAAERLFLRFARMSGSGELVAAVRNAGERLRAVRLVETERWSDCGDELTAANTLAASGSAQELLAAMWNYHRRRIRAAGVLCEAVSRSAPD
ncbi:GntR family transcriptional regulator [Novosphingobium sp. HR1a]|nr:GntR family transcriptional regulator [Novosphingobium sp. HR1a]